MLKKPGVNKIEQNSQLPAARQLEQRDEFSRNWESSFSFPPPPKFSNLASSSCCRSTSQRVLQKHLAHLHFIACVPVPPLHCAGVGSTAVVLAEAGYQAVIGDRWTRIHHFVKPLREQLQNSACPFQRSQIWGSSLDGLCGSPLLSAVAQTTILPHRFLSQDEQQPN